jgi:hypothetical protein
VRKAVLVLMKPRQQLYQNMQKTAAGWLAEAVEQQ